MSGSLDTKKTVLSKPTEVRPVRNVLNTCFSKLLRVLSDEVLERLHHAIEVERYHRLLNQRHSIEPPPPSAQLERGDNL